MTIRGQELSAKGERLEAAAMLRRIVSELDEIASLHEDHRLDIEAAMEKLSRVGFELDPDDES